MHIIQQNISTLVINVLGQYRVSNVKQFYFTGETAVFEHAVLATTQSSIQMRSIAKKISYLLKFNYQLESKMQGYKRAEWILLTTGNMHVHLFLLALRDKYDLDGLWHKAEQK